MESLFVNYLRASETIVPVKSAETYCVNRENKVKGG